MKKLLTNISIIAVAIWVIVYLFILFYPDEISKKLVKWHRNFSDWAYYIGGSLLIPLGVLVKRYFFSGWEDSKNNWFAVIILAIFGLVFIVLGFIFEPSLQFGAY